MHEADARALIDRVTRQSAADGQVHATHGTVEDMVQMMVDAFLTMNGALTALNTVGQGELLAALRMVDDADPSQGAELYFCLALETGGVVETVFSSEVQVETGQRH